MEINSLLSLIDLHNNTLQELSIKGPEWLKVKHLILSKNNLTSIPKKSYPQLRSLDLSHNQFSLIPDNLGKMAPKLEVLKMNNNPIIEIDFHSPITISRLYFKELPHLTIIKKTSFTNVTGRASSIEFEPFVELTISHCPHLETIEEGAFEALNFTDLDLSYNNISTFPSKLTNWTAIPGILNLQGNPLTCDCANEWIISEILMKLYSNTKSQYLLDNLRCASPADKEGLRLVHFYNHITPFCQTGKAYRLLARKNNGEEADEESKINLGSLFPAFAKDAYDQGTLPKFIVVAVCALTVICLVIMGIILQRDIDRRKRESKHRMLFSNL